MGRKPQSGNKRQPPTPTPATPLTESASIEPDPLAIGAAVPSGDTDDDDAERPARKPKQAVVIVHGMGEQRPMETLRSFVQTVWSDDTDLTPEDRHNRKTDPVTGRVVNKSWIRPSPLTTSHELRFITTPTDINGRATDFFELYWSDVTQGTTLERLKAWVWGLLVRPWSDVPTDVRSLYVVLWIAVLLIVGPGIIAAVLKAGGWPSFLCLSAGVWAGIAGAIAVLISAVILPYLGDVAIYVQAYPGTVAKRKEARERGLALLQGLLDDPAYDRVVLVSHSLGTILAYDLLQLLWARNAPGFANKWQRPEMIDAFKEVGKAALPMDSAERRAILWNTGDLVEFRKLQWKTYETLKDPPTGARAWKISDFVTFGSPLTHAEFLLTKNAGELDRSIEERLFSTCPPVSEWESKKTVLFPQTGSPQYPHHAAVFAATRWTNVYDRGSYVITGDPVSGPMLENFGPGVENIRVKLNWRFGRIFTHTTYWSDDATGIECAPAGGAARTHLEVLRYAVDLGRVLEGQEQDSE